MAFGMTTSLGFDIFAKDRASRTFSSIGKAAAGMGRTLAGAAKAGVAGLAVIGAGLIALGPQAFGAAASIELMGRKAGVVFGNQIGRVNQWAKANANAMGLTRREATGLAANFADLLIPMGFTRRQATGMSTDVIGLAGALSEWSGGTHSAAEVADILSAAMLGERDALQSLGISISQAEVDAKLLAKGQEDLTGKALQQAEALATQELLFEKSTDAQKAYAEGQGTLSRRLARSKAQFKEMGETLLVTATPAMKMLADMVKETVLPLFQRFVTWLAGPGKYKIASFFLGAVRSNLYFAEVFLKTLRSTSQAAFKWADRVLWVMTSALGWHPKWARKLSDARANLKNFADKADVNLGKAIEKVQDWDRTVERMQHQVKLRGDIEDLSQKINRAKARLKEKGLTHPQETKIRANITHLQSQVRRARITLANIPNREVSIRARWAIDPVPSRVRGASLIGYASGTTSARPGWAMVGEEGPELVRLRGGEQIFPADQTSRMVRSAGRSSGGHMTVDIRGGDADMRRLIRRWIRTDNLLQGAG